jgi:glycosyltransferase involved in cell wall biosynthesis
MNYPDRTIFCRQAKARQDGRFIILYPGTLSWHQGLDIAIRAFFKIHTRVPYADLHIYGRGTERQNLIDLSGQLNLGGRVLIHDSLSLREIAERMKDADLGIVPKRGDSFGNEAFSTKTLEFMSLGVPVIVAATEIDRLYFRNNEAMFFRPGDDDSLAAAMLKLIENPELRRELTEAANKLVSVNDWDHKKFLYLDIVDSLTSRACATMRESLP